MSTHEQAERGRQDGYRVQGCGCKSWFCDRCAFGRGMRIRKKVRASIGKWKCSMPIMVTLTCNPELFSDAKEAHDFVRKGRFRRFVQLLRKSGFLLSNRYFQVIEFHKNGWPHWHVILDADFVPFVVIRDAWYSLGPKGRPWTHNPMGWVSVNRTSPQGSKVRFRSKDHAACYLTKYLIKPPQHGYPDWVLESPSIFKRYTTSHGLFREVNGEEVEEEPEHDEEGAPSARRRKEYGRVAPTIGGRVALCGSHSVLIYRQVNDGERRTRFVTRIPFSACDMADWLKRDLGVNGFEVTPLEAARLTELARHKSRDELPDPPRGDVVKEFREAGRKAVIATYLGQRKQVGAAGYYREGL